MRTACYCHAMSVLQVKNLPDELHAALAARARAERVTMSEYVIRVLRRDLAKPTGAEWVARRRARSGPVRDIDTLAALDAARAEFGPDGRAAS